MQGKKGQWVQIHNIVLEPADRAPQVPDDTKKVPLVMWVKGYLNADADVGKACEITTVTGRIVKGILDEVEPKYSHDFGQYIPELGVIRDQVRKALGV
jgi:hypothetical protein